MFYTVCYAQKRSKRGALLFATNDTGEIAKDPALANLFPQGYIVVGQKDNTLITTLLDTTPPDEATPETPKVVIYREGKRLTVDLRTRYNNCLSLFKATGCSRCPARGADCLSEEINEPLPPHLGAEVNGEELFETLSRTKPSIANHIFVPPARTRHSVRYPFVARLRPPEEHDFSLVAANTKSLSERSISAADTLKFKRTECVKCPISADCTAWRYCEGPYPTEKEIIEECNAKLAVELKASSYPEWQIWEMARVIGVRTKHSRWQIVATGVSLQGTQGFVPSVYRAKTRITKYSGLSGYEEIAEAFSLAKEEKDAAGSVTDPLLRAVWWLALKGIGAYSRGRGGWYGGQDKVLGVGIDAKEVTALWGRDRYLVGKGSLHTINDVAANLTHQRLEGFEKQHVR